MIVIILYTLWDMYCSLTSILSDYRRIKTNQDKKQKSREYSKEQAVTVTVVHTICKQTCAVSRDVTKIASCDVYNTTSRRGIKHAMFFLFSNESSQEF